MTDETARPGRANHANVEPGEISAPVSAHELDADTLDRLEQRAMGYLDTADAALAGINSYANNLMVFHPENFAGTGISEAVLMKMADFGVLVLDRTGKVARSKESPGLNLPQELKDLIPSYHGLEESKVFTDVFDAEAGEKIDELAATSEVLPAEKPELDAYVRELDVTAQHTPTFPDTSAVVALSYVRLAQFFQQETVRQNLSGNFNLPPDFADLGPAKQGAYLASSHYVAWDIDLTKNTLRDMWPVSAGGSAEQINSYLSEIQLVERRKQLMREHRHKVSAAYKTVVDVSLGQAADAMQELAGLMPAPDTAGLSQAEVETSVSLEAQAIATSRRVAKRAKSIIDIANSLRGKNTVTTPVFSLSQPFPSMETALATHVKQLEAARIAGAAATIQTTEAGRKQALVDELTGLHAPYFMSRPDIKKIPGSNDMTAMMVKGEVGDEECTAEPLVKENAYGVAGLVYRLHGQLGERARSRVFDSLFEAYEKEGPLVEKLGEHAVDFSLRASCDWLIDSVAALQASELETLRRVGDELALYGRTHRTPIGQRIERTARQISAQTLQAIEAARIDAASLDIRAFPPGVSNLEMLEEDALELATRPGKAKIPTLDWARLVAIDDLSVAYAGNGYETQLFRLLPGSLKERFPYYALVINQGTYKVVVAENPKTNNATYVFEELDPNVATWDEIVQLNKNSVRELGGRAMRHNPDHSLKDHFERVNDEVVLRLSAS